jgi:diguanylate cyclase (GGDEF)-like protein/PAS domain S-box-containing protein
VKTQGPQWSIAACFAAVLLITVFAQLASIRFFTTLRSVDVSMSTFHVSQQLSMDVNVRVDEMLLAERGVILYTLVNNRAEVEAQKTLFGIRARRVASEIAQIRARSVGDEERQSVALLDRANMRWVRAAQQIAQECLRGDLTAAIRLDAREGAAAYHVIDVRTDELDAFYKRALAVRQAARMAVFKSSLLVSYAMLAAAVLVTVVAFFLIRRAAAKMTRSADDARNALALTDAIIEALPAVVVIFDAAGTIKRWNVNFLGYEAADVMQRGVMATIAPESLRPVTEAMRQVLEDGRAELEAFLIAADGGKRLIFLSGVRISFDGKPCILGIGIDIGKQRQLEELTRLQAVALESASDAIAITDPDGTIQWVNPAFGHLTGYADGEAIGHTLRILKSGQHDLPFYQALWATILSGDHWSGEVTNTRKDGTLYTADEGITPVSSGGQAISNFVSIQHDVTQRKQREALILQDKEILEGLNRELVVANETIGQLARTDALTGLANRRTLDEKLLEEFARAERTGGEISVIMGDVDHFKAVNDRFGHLAGDQVLASVASQFTGQSRPYDIAARFGGEEFVLVMPDCGIESAGSIAERIRKGVSELNVAAAPIPINISLGVASARRDGSAQDLLARADAALYEAKRAGRNRVVRDVTRLVDAEG